MIASDPQFRKQMEVDPDQAIENSRFGQEIRQLSAQQRAAANPSEARAVCAWTCTCIWTD
jgi:hypothetical protein